MRGVAVAFAIVVLAVAAACGGGGNSSSGAAKHEIRADAQAQAKAINLRLSDFPNGWRASAPESDKAEQSKFRKCIGADYSNVTLVGDATSKDFEQGDNLQANSTAQITRTAAQAADGMRKLETGLGGAATKNCARKAFGSTPGYKVGDIDVGELKAPIPASVDEGQAWEIVAPVEILSGLYKGESPSVYIDVVFLRKGNIVGTVGTVGVPSPFDATLRAHLVRTVAQRMAASA